MMTIDEAIKHCEEVVDRHNRIKQIKAVTLEECKCADEHRQLATWLKELKQLREQTNSSEEPNKWINKPQESEDEKIIRIKKGTLKARTGRYVIYDVEWLKTHFNTTEAKIYGQPREHTEMHACEYESKADKALNLLAEWAIECGFGYDNIPEEYEKYKDDIAEMGYAEGLIYIVKKESEDKKE